jgi:hypothetical protein
MTLSNWRRCESVEGSLSCSCICDQVWVPLPCAVTTSMARAVASSRVGTSRCPFRTPSRALLGCTRVRIPGRQSLERERRWIRRLHRQAPHKSWVPMKSTSYRMPRLSKTSGEVSQWEWNSHFSHNSILFLLENRLFSNCTMWRACNFSCPVETFRASCQVWNCVQLGMNLLLVIHMLPRKEWQHPSLRLTQRYVVLPIYLWLIFFAGRNPFCWLCCMLDRMYDSLLDT